MLSYQHPIDISHVFSPETFHMACDVWLFTITSGIIFKKEHNERPPVKAMAVILIMLQKKKNSNSIYCAALENTDFISDLES